MNAPVLDLLRERRAELGLETLSAALTRRRGLLRRGLLIGGALLGTVAAATLLVFLQRQFLRAQMGQLLQFEAQSEELRGRLAARRGRVGRLTAANRRLADALTSVRASSALLADLQLRTPEGVQLLSADARGGNLVLKGQAKDPRAFQRINALQLELQRSPLLKGADLTLTRAERVAPKAPPGTPQGAPLPPGPVSFELTGPFASLPPDRHLAVLRALGSEGLARRLQVLEKEGLLP